MLSAFLLVAAGTSVSATPLVSAVATSRSIQLRPDQLLSLAETAQTHGDARTAETAYKALSHDPNPDIRNEARFRYSKMLAARGSNTDAAVLLRQILDEKPDAGPVRLELAGLLDRMGDKDGAWRQVRAIHASGLPPSVARLVDRYSEALRAKRPFGASFEIALAPDSNINRATTSDTLGTVLGDFQISDEGKARSGTGVSLSSQAYRRFSRGGDTSLLMRLSGFGNLYREKEFNDIAADLAAGPEFYLGRNRLQLEIGATQRWFGQKPFTRSARAAATLSHPIGGRTLLRVNGFAALVDNRVNDLEDGKSFSGQLSLEHALTETTGIAASFGLTRENLKSPGYSTSGWRGGLTAWRDMGRMTLTLGAEFGRLHADERLVLFPDKRADRYSKLSVGATFRQLQFRGFAPLARFSLERNRSSVEFYDYRRARTEIGVVRAF
jgi:hypothetical protein